jgi:hypothetical protein
VKLLQADINRDITKISQQKHVLQLIEERNIIKSPTEMDADGNIVKSFKNLNKVNLNWLVMVMVHSELNIIG